MKILKTYQDFLNEELKHLPPPTDDETAEGIKDMDLFRRLDAIEKYNLDKKYYPTDQEIKNGLNKIYSVRDTLDKCIRYDLNPKIVVPILLKIKDKEEPIDIHYVLYDAIDEDSITYIKYALENGSSVNQIFINVDDSYSYPIIRATVKGYLDIVKYLVENGADINLCGDDKYTALHYACLYNYYEIVQYLVEHGADMYIKNIYGKRPIDIAIKKNDEGYNIKITGYIVRYLNQKMDEFYDELPLR